MTTNTAIAEARGSTSAELFLTCSYYRSICRCNGPGKEGTMCTAFSYCRVHQQRLRAAGSYAPSASGSSGVGPWTLRPKRLQWLTNINIGFKIAAFFKCWVGFGAPVPASSFPRKRESMFLRREEMPAFAGMTAQGVVRADQTTRISQALSLSAISHSTLSICGLEAMAGTSPPFSLTPLRPP